jgi:hypothetical protein
MNVRWIYVSGIVIALASGCQCCPWYDSYANVVDDASDTHVYFDHLYNPRLDLTRMGKPDWCSPFNRFFCKRCCNNGCYDRYDECNLYPPFYPNQLPSSIMPPPTVRTSRLPKPADPDEMPISTPSSSEADPAPAPEAVPSPAPQSFLGTRQRN